MVNLKNLGQILKDFQKLNLQVIVELHQLNVLVGFLQDLGITREETELLIHYSILFQFFNQDLMQKVLNIFKRKSLKGKARNLPANTLPDKFLTKFFEDSFCCLICNNFLIIKRNIYNFKNFHVFEIERILQKPPLLGRSQMLARRCRALQMREGIY